MKFLGVQIGSDTPARVNSNCKNYKCVGFPWWSSGKESTFQCRGRGFNPWLEN